MLPLYTSGTLIFLAFFCVFIARDIATGVSIYHIIFVGIVIFAAAVKRGLMVSMNFTEFLFGFGKGFVGCE
jgi:hypothetical protein